MMHKALSLIELLIVVTITILFIGMTLVEYNLLTQQLKLKNEAKKMVDILELAKKKALSADLADLNCSDFSGYQVVINQNSYTLNFCCDSLCPLAINTFAIASDVSVVSGTGNLNFPPLMRGLNFDIDTIKLKNTVINKCVQISISPIGVVDLDETLTSC